MDNAIDKLTDAMQRVLVEKQQEQANLEDQIRMLTELLRARVSEVVTLTHAMKVLRGAEESPAYEPIPRTVEPARRGVSIKASVTAAVRDVLTQDVLLGTQVARSTLAMAVQERVPRLALPQIESTFSALVASGVLAKHGTKGALSYTLAPVLLETP